MNYISTVLLFRLKVLTPWLKIRIFLTSQINLQYSFCIWNIKTINFLVFYKISKSEILLSMIILDWTILSTMHWIESSFIFRAFLSICYSMVYYFILLNCQLPFNCLYCFAVCGFNLSRLQIQGGIHKQRWQARWGCYPCSKYVPRVSGLSRKYAFIKKSTIFTHSL